MSICLVLKTQKEKEKKRYIFLAILEVVHIICKEISLYMSIGYLGSCMVMKKEYVLVPTNKKKWTCFSLFR